MTWFATLNRSAGKTPVGIDDVHRAANDVGLSMTVSVSDTAQSATEAVTAAIADGQTRFLAIGGDGTANLVANALFSHPSDARFSLGIITGDVSFNPLYSWLIPGPDDGKVGVDNARVAGAADFLVLPATHTFIMNRTDAADATIRFIRNGRFQRP